jgi:hypothetical protein
VRNNRDDHRGRRHLAMNSDLGLILAWLVRAVDRSFRKSLRTKVKRGEQKVHGALHSLYWYGLRREIGGGMPTIAIRGTGSV